MIMNKSRRIFYIGFSFLFAMLLLLSTCKQIDLFPEYRGTNLIENIPLANWVPDQATTTPYMNYEQVTGTGYEPPSDHTAAEVYRLEIKNLIPNGDFETGVSPPPGWTLFPGGDTLEVVNSGSGQISGNTMHFALNDAADRVDYDTRGANPVTDGFLKNASYLIRFNYRTNGSLVFEFNDTANSIDWWKFYGGDNGGTNNITLTNLLEFPPGELKGSFPEQTVGDNVDYYFSFGSMDSNNSGPQEGYIDNVRLIRTDLTYKLRLDLSYQGDTAEPLISGDYRFSIYVKDDPSAGSNNRLTSNRVCIGITGGGVASVGTTFDESSFSVYRQYYNGLDGEDWSNWSKVSVDLVLQIPNSSSRVMELSICPTDDSQGSLNMDVGSILISSPSLEMFPDGFP